MIAVVFPGQGSQYVGMGKDFYDKFEVIREIFDRASTKLGVDMRRLIFESTEDELRLTENAQPAILTASYAIYSLVKDRFKNISFFAGHSLGEYTACVASGVISFEDAVYAVRMRGKFMQDAVPLGEGKMVAVMGLLVEDVENICREVEGVVEPANYNSPDQIVVSGRAEDVDRFVELAKSRGAKRVVALNVSAPFHCSLMKPAADRLKPILEMIRFNDPAVPIVSNVTADIVNSGAEERDLLVKQVYMGVRWYQSVNRMVALGVSTFIEIGPSKVLTGLIRRTAKGVNTLNIEVVGDLEKLEEIL
ncbi:MAG: ACP S-malonyltransferase [Thermosulfidibacteraceae bacterium]|jgi:[acyl-carrier-protein] S-malonyltransferase